jgi:hypothetical protein
MVAKTLAWFSEHQTMRLSFQFWTISTGRNPASGLAQVIRGFMGGPGKKVYCCFLEHEYFSFKEFESISVAIYTEALLADHGVYFGLSLPSAVAFGYSQTTSLRLVNQNIRFNFEAGILCFVTRGIHESVSKNRKLILLALSK